MSRNISRLEKTLVFVLIIAVIFVAGWFLVVSPSYDEIGVMDSKIASRRDDIQRAQDLKNRADEIEVEYEIKLERAQSVHEGFYEEMTTTEAVTMVQDILHKGNVTPLNGIEVSDIGEKLLNIELSDNEREINYQLRHYAFLFNELPEALGELEVDEYGAYVTPEPQPVHHEEEAVEAFNAIVELTTYIATKHNPEEVELMISEFSSGSPSAKVLLLREITTMLSDKSFPLSDESREGFLDYMRYELYALGDIGVGLITASFEAEMPYARYTAFLDYLQDLPELTSVDTAILWEDPRAAGNENRGYKFDLELLVMMPMEIVEVPDNPGKIDHLNLDGVGEVIVVEVEAVEEPPVETE